MFHGDILSPQERPIVGQSSCAAARALTQSSPARQAARPACRRALIAGRASAEFDDSLSSSATISRRPGQRDARSGMKRGGAAVEADISRILKSAHRDAGGLFQSVHVGDRQDIPPISDTNAAKLRQVPRHAVRKRCGLYSEAALMPVTAASLRTALAIALHGPNSTVNRLYSRLLSWASRRASDRASSLRLEIAVRNDKPVFETAVGDLERRGAVQRCRHDALQRDAAEALLRCRSGSRPPVADGLGPCQRQGE